MLGAFVLIQAEAGRIADLGHEIANIDGVREAHSVAGGEVDLVAVLRVATHDDIARVVTEQIARLPGIRTTRTLISFRQYSDDQLEAGYADFGD